MKIYIILQTCLVLLELKMYVAEFNKKSES